MENYNNKDDAEKLLQQFTKEKSFPDRDFTEQLKTHVLYKSKSNNLFINFFRMNVKKLALLGSGLFVFLAITLTSGYLLLRPSKSTTDVLTLSGSDTQRILQNLMQNNSKGSYMVNYQNENAFATAKGESDFAESMLYPVINQYKYYHSKSQITAGPGKDKCEVYSNVETGIYETYEYFDENNFYSKYIFKDGSNNLLDSTLSGNTYMIEYKGGKYAVKVEYENSGDTSLSGNPKNPVVESIDSEESGESPSEPAPDNWNEPDEMDIQDIIDSIWGENVKVEEVKTDGKLEYYIVTWEEQTSCDLNVMVKESQTVSMSKSVTDTDEETEDMEKIVRKSWIDPESYQIFKEETYFTEIKPENLIQTNEMEQETSNADFESVKDKFNFDYNVEVRTLTRNDLTFDPYVYETDREKYLDEVESFIKSENISVLFPQDKKWLLDSAYLASVYRSQEYNYYQDRDFYPEGSLGDTMYTEMKEAYSLVGTTEALGYLDFRTKNYEYYISASIFDEGIDTDQVLNEMFGMTESTEKSQIEIIIDGKKVTAQRYTMEESWNVSPSSGGEEPISNDDPVMKEETSEKETDSYTTVAIVFDYAGSRYIIVTGFDSTAKKIENIGTSYKSYEAGKPNELKQLIDMIEEMLVATADDTDIVNYPEEDVSEVVPMEG
ncbi:MAG: hypothetical protein ABIE03_01205 [Patescibacteria group bacterium]|nr:hypothetical protein [Patescibacteria group bacterium]